MKIDDRWSNAAAFIVIGVALLLLALMGKDFIPPDLSGLDPRLQDCVSC